MANEKFAKFQQAREKAEQQEKEELEKTKTDGTEQQDLNKSDNTEEQEGEESSIDDEKEYEIFYDYKEIKETREKQKRNVFGDIISKQAKFQKENLDIRNQNKFNIDEWAPLEEKKEEPEVPKKGVKSRVLTLVTERSATSNHETSLPSGRKVKMTQKEMQLVEKYEGDALKTEIENILETLESKKKDSKDSSKESSLNSQNLSKKASRLKMKKSKSAFPE